MEGEIMSFDIHTRNELYTNMNTFLETNNISKGDTLYASYNGNKVSFNTKGDGAKVPDSFLSRYENHYLNTEKNLKNLSKIQNNVIQLRSGSGALKKFKNWFKALFNKRVGTNTFEKRLLESLTVNEKKEYFKKTAEHSSHKINYLLASRLIDDILDKGADVSVDKQSIKNLKDCMEHGARLGGDRLNRDKIRVNDFFLNIDVLIDNAARTSLSKKTPEPESKSFIENISVEKKFSSVKKSKDKAAPNPNIDPHAPPPPPLPTSEDIKNIKKAKKEAYQGATGEPSTVGQNKVGTAGSPDITPEKQENLNKMAGLFSELKKKNNQE